MTISVPHSLNEADASMKIAESLSRLLDPKERAKIADDIKAHHALNDTEAKKAEEARSLINEHKEVLEATKAEAAGVAKSKKDLAKERSDFIELTNQENLKLDQKKSLLAEESKKQKIVDYKSALAVLLEARNDGLLEDISPILAKELKEDIAKQREDLDSATKLNEGNVIKLAKDRKSFDEEKDERLKVLKSLDDEIKAKREIIDALKKFNI